MTLLDRYIGKQVVRGTLVALSILVALFSIVELIDDMESVGKGDYRVPNALEYMLLRLPAQTFSIFPVAALIGSLMGLGALASRSELTAARAAGVSVARIVASVMKGGGLLMIAALLIGEVLAPYSERLAQERRSVALTKRISLHTKYGFWIRDGTSFINIRVVLPGDVMEGVYIFEFDKHRHLRVLTHARRAVYVDRRWQLEDLEQSEIHADRVETRRIAKAIWKSSLLPDQVDVVSVKPESLSAFGLYKYVGYLAENGLNPRRYELALWNKVVFPLATGVMVFMAITLVLGRLRSVGIGQRMLVGAIVGVVFQILNQVFMQVGIVFELAPAVTAITPTVVFFGVGIWMMRQLQ